MNNASIINVGSKEKTYDGSFVKKLGVFCINSISFPFATSSWISSIKLSVFGTIAFLISFSSIFVSSSLFGVFMFSIKVKIPVFSVSFLSLSLFFIISF